MILCEISEQELSPQKAIDFVSDDKNGAIDLFMGVVRNHNLGRPTIAVTYDAHAILAKKALEEICAEALKKFGEDLRIYVAHFLGRLEINGISVIIAIGSLHRDAAFKACRYVIDELKIRAPIWKYEHYQDGESEWLKGTSLNDGIR